ncbi:hypothetical protein WMY93_000093 [Mugilogobius chulae]|uniref:Uncharacterized protein n=1 Tax=Mugilogobius chulae TaxID=88201 RepID=A0AAW0Q909_9GOBI
MQEAYERKRERYAELAAECRDNGWKTKIYSVEIGCRGFASFSARCFLRDVGYTAGKLKKALKDFGLEAEKATAGSCRERQGDVPVRCPTILRCSGDQRGETSVKDGSQLKTLQLASGTGEEQEWWWCSLSLSGAAAVPVWSSGGFLGADADACFLWSCVAGPGSFHLSSLIAPSSAWVEGCGRQCELEAVEVCVLVVVSLNQSERSSQTNQNAAHKPIRTQLTNQSEHSSQTNQNAGGSACTWDTVSNGPGHSVQRAGPQCPTGRATVSNGPVLKSNRPVLKSNRPVLKSNRPVLKSNRPVLKSNRPVLKSNSPVLKSNGPVLKSNRPVLKSNRPVLMWFVNCLIES